MDSIAYFIITVDDFGFMSALRDLLSQHQLGPAKAPRGADVPRAFCERQVRFEDHHVPRPSDFHRLPHDGGIVFVHTVKRPHPAHIARGEAADVRIRALQMLRHGHGSALLRPFTDQPADFPVQLHLRQRGANSFVNGFEQFAVVDCFSDVHRLLLSGAVRLIIYCSASVFPLNFRATLIPRSATVPRWMMPEPNLLRRASTVLSSF